MDQAAQHAVLVERINEALDLIRRGETKETIMIHLRTALSEDSGSALLERLHQIEVSSGVLRDVIEAANAQLAGKVGKIKRGDRTHQLLEAVVKSDNGSSALNAMRHLDNAVQNLRHVALLFLEEHEQRQGGVCQCPRCINAKIALANLGQRTV